MKALSAGRDGDDEVAANRDRTGDLRAAAGALVRADHLERYDCTQRCCPEFLAAIRSSRGGGSGRGGLSAALAIPDLLATS